MRPLSVSLAIVAALSIPAVGVAENPPPKHPSVEVQKRLARHNARQAKKNDVLDLLQKLGLGGFETFDQTVKRPLRPYAEYEEAGAVFFSAETHYASKHVKEAILRNLPPTVLAVIY